MQDVVSTQWLVGELGADDLCIIDASQHDFEPERDPAAEYKEAHIPRAVFLDLDTLVDPCSSVKNMMPGPDQFSARMQDLGVDRGQRILIYDDSILKTGLRAWFMFKLFGLDNVAYLDGGLAKWKSEGHPLESTVVRPARSAFSASYNPSKIRGKSEILANIETKAEQLVDGRGVEHFSGVNEDPDPKLASGHIPGSVNVPFWDLFNEDGTFKDPKDLRALFFGAGVDLDKPVVTSCGGGVVACALNMAMRLFGKDDSTLYDGSWNEWGKDPHLPKATGLSTIEKTQ